MKRIALSANTSWFLVNFFSGLIRGLDEAGYEVVALTPDDADSPRLAALGVRHVPIAIDGRGRSPVGDSIVFGRYFVELLKVNPQAFLGFTVKPNVYGSLAAGALGIPVVNTVPGLGKAFAGNDWLTRLIMRLYRVSLRRSRIVFFQNENDRATFIENRLVDRGSTALVPGAGVDLSRFAPDGRVSNGPGGSFSFLLSGRLLWDKGVGEFVEAARIVRRQMPGTRFQLLGFLDAEDTGAIPAAIVQSWVDEGLMEYLGAVEDVRPALAAADCIVLPTYYPEGVPNALLEAAAMAKPLIATDIPGCRRIVEHGWNGFLCRARDADDLAARMVEMIHLSPQIRQVLGVRGRKKTEEHFDERFVVDRYIDALDQIIKSTSKLSS